MYPFKITLITVFLFITSVICKAQEGAYFMFRGNLQHNAVYKTAAVKTNPSIKWKFKTGGYVNSSAAIDGNSIFFGSGDGYFYCLDVNTGVLKWKYKTGGPVHSSPALFNGAVFFGSHDGNFYALNSSNGKPKWIFKTEGEKRFSAYGIHGNLPKDSLFIDQWDFWLSSPAIQNNTVYFGSGDGNFYALHIDDGKEKWKFKTNGIIHSSPALAYGNVYFGGWDTYMHALNAETGAEVWKFKTGEDTAIYNQTGITGSPVIADNMLYFGCRDSHVYALDAKSGNLIWKKFNDRGWISISPVIYGDRLYYTSGSSKIFAALNKNTGDSIYKYPITSGIFSSPSIVGSTLYYGDMNGIMLARNVKTGQPEWSFRVDGAKADELKILNTEAVIDVEKYTAAVKKYDGQKISMDVRLSVGSILSSPVIKNGVIYFGSTDGNFYALQ